MKHKLALEEQIRRYYLKQRGIPTEQMELSMSEDNRSFLDKMFDAADSALGGLEKGLTPAQPDPKPDDIIEAEFTDSRDTRREDWENTHTMMLHITPAQHAGLVSLAKKQGVTLTDLVNKLLAMAGIP